MKKTLKDKIWAIPNGAYETFKGLYDKYVYERDMERMMDDVCSPSPSPEALKKASTLLDRLDALYGHEQNEK